MTLLLLYPFPTPLFFNLFPVANTTLSTIVAIVNTPPTIAQVLDRKGFRSLNKCEVELIGLRSKEMREGLAILAVYNEEWRDLIVNEQTL